MVARSKLYSFAFRVSIVAASAATALTLTGTVAVAAPRHRPTTVPVVMTLDEGFTLPQSVRAGWVTFEVSTPDVSGGFLHYLQGFRTLGAADPDVVVADLRAALSPDPATAAAGIAATARDADLVGGAAVDAATTVSVTLPLTAGTYYFFDLNDLFVPGQQAVLHKLRVVGGFIGHAPAADATIAMRTVAGAPRFVAPTRLPAGGTFRIVNASDEIHELATQKVVPGTTDVDIQRFFDSGTTTPFAEPSLRGAGAISPGRIVYLRIERLSAGPYAFMCFVPGKHSGVPHAIEGMHTVATMH
ncbi:hypothetical protein Pa4123_05640 [Phytohabitans aurantiacus]|uniref:Blue (type 1) copper domain-containing protein n=2 Tax=Phytohabitans aurantiacus TaxID=3016789 RepID=A0ABQ5QN90_9ACTN|nr:hypothetical protein Pa4123_05640 [Phytohabitans aurantiacus]